MTDPNDMLLFAAVVREGGFTAAARAVGLTKQSVSERMAGFERALGVQLLTRTTRVVRPTEAGAAYYARVASIAAQIDEANQELLHRQAEPTGVLRVSAPVLYGRRFLGGIVADYLRRHPRARCEIALADRLVDVVAEGFDLAIRVGDLPDSSLTARTIGLARVHFVASPRYLKLHGRPRTPEALRKLPLIALQPGESWRIGPRDIKVDPILLVNDLEAACDAAERGVGIARVTSLVCAESLRKGRLRDVFEDAAPIWRRVHALYPTWPHHHEPPPKVRPFLASLLAHAPGLTPVPR